MVQGAYYRDLADGNQIAEENLRAPRGIIYDRFGKVLARNVPVYRECNNVTKPQGNNVALEPCSLVTNEKAIKIEAEGENEAAKLKLDLGREYPEASVTAHVLGYVNETNESNLTNGTYKLGDFIGRTGIEQQYEKILRGIDGKELIQRDASGKKLKTLGKIEPLAGQNLTLTLDLNLQKAAAKEMEGKTGAVVVSNPQTGEILALFSNPSFDPNDLSRQGDFFNRAISGLYPPGSTFKIITSAAALEEGKINAQTKIEDTGVIKSGAFSFGNWYYLQYGKTEGLVGLVKALKRSNDIFFYRVAEMVGIEKLENWSRKFGLAKTLGIDLPSEGSGQVRRERAWYLGDTYHTGIGQGDLEVTPLQVNFWTNAIANGGKLCRPRLTNLSNSAKGGSSDAVASLFNCKPIGISKETISLITEGMKEACSEGGTGWPFFGYKVTKLQANNATEKEGVVACKTGTSEFGDPKNRTHAWFTVFGPVSRESRLSREKWDRPQISVTVLVEAGGEGSNVAAPIAKKILEEYFK